MVIPVRQASRTPVTLWALRMLLGLQVLAIAAQPVLAGIYLTGDVDAIGIHAGVAIGVAALTLLATLAAAADVLAARGRWRVLGATIVLLAGVITQVTFGFQRTLGVHVPLGVAVVAASVLLNLWVWARRPEQAVNRRSFLGLLGATAAGAGIAGCGRWLPGQTGDQLTSAVPLPAPYRVPLPVPPVARPAGRLGDADLYRITQKVAQAEILPGVRTPILGYDGIFPGPTIEARRGRPVVVRHRNELPVPTVAHLHGGHTPAGSDGWPLDLLLPAGNADGWTHHGMVGDAVVGERDHVYPSGQRAATLWYHDHRMDFTGPAVYRGLAGFHLIRDAEEDALPLPGGDRELPLMIADRAFAADGSFAYPALDQGMRALPGVAPGWMGGVLGDVVLVNGAPWPVHEVDAARYRLRILNASNARRYGLALRVPGAPDLPFVQIGSDGGLLAAPVALPTIETAPGERFDVVVDFSRVPVGTQVTMVNTLGTGSTADVMAFRVVRSARDDSAVPDRLARIDPLVPGPTVRTFRFQRGPAGGHTGWTINDTAFDPATSLADIPLGAVERWRFVTDVHHPVHVHLDPVQVLRRGAGGPGPYDTGWKDTVDLRPAEVVEVAVRFTDFAGRFVFHCHNLEHEDMAMMGTIHTV